MFHGYHHIGLRVQDMDKTLRFYTEGLGGTVTHQFPMSDGRLIYLIDLGENAVVELIPAGGSEAEANARWMHIAVNADDVQAAHDRALAAGARVKHEPKDAMLGTMAVSNSFVYGPEGEEIEFFHVK